MIHRKKACRNALGFCRSRILLLPMLCAAVAVSPFSVSAVDHEPDGPSLPPSELPELEAFMDGAVITAMEANNALGAIVSVVHKGKTVLAKGYGYADEARSVPVSGSSTRFSVASVSKTLVWTSVMQLVERGSLNLDVDVNSYLTQFQIPDTYEQPVTLRHILAHTAGFEDRVFGLFYRDVERLQTPEDALAYYIPKRVRAPGTYPAYSNWATALAGLIVANVSGVSFNRYVADNILTPLDMTFSTFVEPIPDEKPGTHSGAFRRTAGDYVDDGFIFSGLGPAAALSATAEDMAKFMIAHLGDGSFDGQRILKPETVLQMREPTHRQHKAMKASLHGFREYTHNGRFAYGHGGNHVYFLSTLVMVPEEDVGIFVSFNTLDSSAALTQLKNAFFDRYYPRKPAQDVFRSTYQGSALPASNESLEDYPGSYLSTRRNYSTWAKGLSDIPGLVKVSIAEKGGLLVGGKRYIAIDEDVFQNTENADQRIAFERDEAGEISYLFDSPHRALQKLTGLDNRVFHLVVVLLALLTMLLVIVYGIWKVRVWWRSSRIEKLLVGALLSASLINLIFLAKFMPTSLLGFLDLYLGDQPSVSVLLSLPLIAACLSIGALLASVILWLRDGRSLIVKLRYSGAASLLVAFAWILNYWNLLGPWYLQG